MKGIGLDKSCARIDCPAFKYEFAGRIRKSQNGCWVWTGSFNNKGRAVVWIRQANTPPRFQSAAKIAWELNKKRKFPKDQFALHHCDQSHCVRPSHIYPGTQTENMRDRIMHGAGYDNRGIKNPRCKLPSNIFDGIEPIIQEIYHEGQISLNQLAIEVSEFVNMKVSAKIIGSLVSQDV